MAERKRMTCEQVVGYLLEGEGLDFLRESLSWVVQQLMEAEVSVLGLDWADIDPERRLLKVQGEGRSPAERADPVGSKIRICACRDGYVGWIGNVNASHLSVLGPEASVSAVERKR
jgi:hypothetical protein